MPLSSYLLEVTVDLNPVVLSTAFSKELFNLTLTILPIISFAFDFVISRNCSCFIGHFVPFLHDISCPLLAVAFIKEPKFHMHVPLSLDLLWFDLPCAVVFSGTKFFRPKSTFWNVPSRA